MSTDTDGQSPPAADGPRGTGSPAPEASRPAEAPRSTPERSWPQVDRRSPNRPSGVLFFTLLALTALLIAHALFFARSLLLPFVIALLLQLLLRPIVNALVRVKVPKAVASALVVGSLVALIGVAAWQAIDPVSRWVEDAPRELARIERKLRHLKRPVEQVSKATEQVEKMTQLGGERAQRTVVARQEPASSVLAEAGSFVAAVVVVFVLTYFLLGWGDALFESGVRLLPKFGPRRTALRIARKFQPRLSRYLLTMAAINAGLGIVEGTALWLLDMPNPFVLGMLMGLLNFAPYLGPTAGTLIIGAFALIQFDQPAQAIIPPLVALAISGLEGQVVTPLILGRSLTLNPVFVFTGIIFWFWFWGVAGALLAVPLLVCFKLVCEEVPRLKPLAEFLGR